MLELIEEYIPKIQSGEFFKDNISDLMTSQGLQSLFITAVITGFIFMLSKVFNGDSNGIASVVWYIITGFLCTGLAELLFQILTGIPLKIL